MRILILRISSLGDAIHTLPALDILRKNLPHASIDWLVQEKTAGIVNQVPGLAHVYTLSNKYLYPRYWRKTVNLLAKLRSNHYSIIIDFQGLLKTSMVNLALNAPSIGFSWHCARESLSSLMHTKNIYIPPSTSIIEKNNALAYAAVKMLTGTDVNKELAQLDTGTTLQSAPQPSSTAAEQVQNWLTTNNAKNCIVLSPNTTWESKHWPIKRWEELVFKMGTIPRYSVVLVGQNFGEQGQRLASFIQEHALPILIAPAWTLDAVVALMQHTKVIIAPDTGLLHIADCMGVATIGIYGPTKVKKHGPQITVANQARCFQVDCTHDYQKNHAIIKNSSDTQDCMYKLCAETVLQRIHELVV